VAGSEIELKPAVSYDKIKLDLSSVFLEWQMVNNNYKKKLEVPDDKTKLDKLAWSQCCGR
jgi:hypothetical protein